MPTASQTPRSTDTATPRPTAAPAETATTTATVEATEEPDAAASPVATSITGAYCDADREGAKAGQEVVVTCSNFPADEEIVLYWDEARESAEIDTFTADRAGSGEVAFLAPETPSGRYQLIARSAETRVTASVQLDIRPGLFLVPKTGDAGDVVSADLTGFQAGESVVVAWHDDEESSRELRTVVAGEDGSVTTTFRAPRAEPGTYTIEASGATGARARASFRIEDA